MFLPLLVGRLAIAYQLGLPLVVIIKVLFLIIVMVGVVCNSYRRIVVVVDVYDDGL
jgi:hypothetical protein